MHEISLMESLFEILDEIILSNKLESIKSVTVSIGRMKQIIPETFSFAFDALKKDTAAENAELVMEFVPVKIRCSECGHEEIIRENIYLCRICGSNKTDVIEGDEIIIKRIEAEK